MPLRAHRIRAIGTVLVAVALGLGAGCSKNDADQAMASLTRAGFAFSVDDFHRAAKAGNARATEDFLRAGMAVDVRNTAGLTPLGTACMADAVEVAAVLLQHGAGVSEPQPDGRTPLMLAAATGSGPLVKRLIQAGADPSARDPGNWHPLGIAVWNGRKDAAEVLAPLAGNPVLDEGLLLAALKGDVALCDVLLRRGASVMARDGENRTPLMLAARGGHPDVARLLVENGANRFALDTPGGRTAAQFADQAAAEAQPLGDTALAERCRALSAWLSSPPRSEENIGVFTDPREVVTPSGDGPDETMLAAASAGRIRLADPLARSTLRVPRPGLDGLEAGWRFTEYRERPIPVALDGVAADGETARFRQLFGPQAVVEAKAGETVPGTPWKVVSVRPLTGEAKDQGSPSDLSVVEIAFAAGGPPRRLAVGGESTAEEPMGVLAGREGGTPVLARRGDVFQLAGDPASYRVIDLSPEQIVIEETGSRKTLTLRRESPPAPP